MQDQIIQFLKNCEGYLSGEEISRHLKISRAGIWKYMQELRKEGYDIVAVPHLGYKLVSSPDKILPGEIQFKLGTHILGKKIYHYDSVASTMDAAFKLGLDGEKEGAVVCAETQTKGRGRLGRVWSSPKGKGIYMSVLLRPPLSPTNVAQMTLMAAVAVAEAVRKVSGVAVTIKWPNDLVVNGLKIAGMLTELNAEMDRVRFVVIGMGLNVNTPLNLLPANSTSLKHEAKKQFSRVEVMQEILRSLERWYGILVKEGFPKVRSRWKEMSLTLGKQIRIIDPNSEVEGQAVDLDDYGSLMIRHNSGLIIKRMTGDVVQVR